MNQLFFEALAVWREKQLEYAKAREVYRLKWADMFTANDGTKPESARKTKTDSQTSELRIKRDLAEVEATAAWQALLVVRGPTDFSRQPGYNFGDAA